jgi:hypothetical protein
VFWCVGEKTKLCRKSCKTHGLTWERLQTSHLGGRSSGGSPISRDW